MMPSIQCQNGACRSTFEIPSGVATERPLVNLCPKCGTRYAVNQWGGSVTSLRKLDRVSLQPLPGLSERAKHDLAEAARALNADAPTAASVMLRRAVEQMCEDLGATEGRLVDKIDSLKARGVFKPVTAAAAHAVRIFGNDGAHTNARVYDAVTLDDAEEAFDLVVRLAKSST